MQRRRREAAEGRPGRKEGARTEERGRWAASCSAVVRLFIRQYVFFKPSHCPRPIANRSFRRAASHASVFRRRD